MVLTLKPRQMLFLLIADKELLPSFGSQTNTMVCSGYRDFQMKTNINQRKYASCFSFLYREHKQIFFVGKPFQCIKIEFKMY